jgi:hypothetical protein
MLFKSALATYVGAAEPARRGEAASSLFVFAYLGLIIPVLGLGVATLYASAQTAMLVFTGALLVILAAIVTLALRRSGRSRVGDQGQRIGSRASKWVTVRRGRPVRIVPRHP